MQKNSFIFHWRNTSLEMLSSRALFLPQTNELLICDIHLGKGEYFQKNGIPLPNKADETNLLRIKQIVKKHNPKKLIILGDLFHSKDSISKPLRNKIELLSETLNINIELIVGNHDKGCEIKNIKSLKIKKTNNFIFSHEPIIKFDNNILNICGHYHPKLYISNAKDKLSFRCFAMDTKNNILYLPAFGELTGGYPCKNDFKKWAIISDKLILEI